MIATSPERAYGETGPIGPVAISALVVLLATAPLMRGGNRHLAMIALEGVALVFLVAALAGTWRITRRPTLRDLLLVFLVASPAWLALVYLLPVSVEWWRSTPGRDVYPELLASARIAVAGKLPLSLVPDATAASLFAGIPIAAAFVAGYAIRMRQLKLALGVFVVLAFLQVVFGLLQIAGGIGSSLYFGTVPGRPVGTFANPNHFANYVAMALPVYIWFARAQLTEVPRRGGMVRHRATEARIVALWIAGAVVLLVGILMSWSRGAALAGLPAAIAAFGIAMTGSSRSRSVRAVLLVACIALAAALALVGLQPLLARFQMHSMASDASFRTLLAITTFDGAKEFWPWGAGWGTYAGVYPRFQPLSVVGIAEYAHQDYAQLLFEGGIFSVLLAAAFGYLVVERAVVLVRAALRRRRLSRAEMASALCGMALLGFLLHSIVEFNMHIPANAIAAALLAGAFLRPLNREEGSNGD